MYELPRLLNYLTSPDVLIWSAIVTSCSIPFIFSSSEIMAKDPKTHQTRPWNPFPERWIDGSVDNDLPMAKLSELFNVNYFIVSQANPHIIPFLEQSSSRRQRFHNIRTAVTNGNTYSGGASLYGMTARLVVSEVMHHMRVMSELGIFPFLCTKIQVNTRENKVS
jgi:TAG lipase/steryl ester hydrolase/phospholipase A2/LPA acyltransferase